MAGLGTILALVNFMTTVGMRAKASWPTPARSSLARAWPLGSTREALHAEAERAVTAPCSLSAATNGGTLALCRSSPARSAC
jgi:hypothetical protein